MRYIFAMLAMAFSLPGMATAKEEAIKDPETIRCRMIKEIGSRIPKRICKTNAEWAREAAMARQAMEERNRSSHCSERC